MEHRFAEILVNSLRQTACEEEPKMNFDTNVIGPSNINLIGGGSGLQLQQDTFETLLVGQSCRHSPVT